MKNNLNKLINNDLCVLSNFKVERFYFLLWALRPLWHFLRKENELLNCSSSPMNTVSYGQQLFSSLRNVFAPFFIGSSVQKRIYTPSVVQLTGEQRSEPGINLVIYSYFEKTYPFFTMIKKQKSLYGNKQKGTLLSRNYTVQSLQSFRPLRSLLGLRVVESESEGKKNGVGSFFLYMPVVNLSTKTAFVSTTPTTPTGSMSSTSSSFLKFLKTEGEGEKGLLDLKVEDKMKKNSSSTKPIVSYGVKIDNNIIPLFSIPILLKEIELEKKNKSNLNSSSFLTTRLSGQTNMNTFFSIHRLDDPTVITGKTSPSTKDRGQKVVVVVEMEGAGKVKTNQNNSTPLPAIQSNKFNYSYPTSPTGLRTGKDTLSLLFKGFSIYSFDLNKFLKEEKKGSSSLPSYLSSTTSLPSSLTSYTSPSIQRTQRAQRDQRVLIEKQSFPIGKKLDLIKQFILMNTNTNSKINSNSNPNSNYNFKSNSNSVVDTASDTVTSSGALKKISQGRGSGDYRTKELQSYDSTVELSSYGPSFLPSYLSTYGRNGTGWNGTGGEGKEIENSIGGNLTSLGKTPFKNEIENGYENDKNNKQNIKDNLNIKSKPIINLYLKEMSKLNMTRKGVFIHYSEFIGYHFNKQNNKFFSFLGRTEQNKNIYKLLAASFKSMYCLISKPVFISTPDKVIIQLFYFLFIPNILKLKKFYKHKYSSLYSKLFLLKSLFKRDEAEKTKGYANYSYPSSSASATSVKFKKRKGSFNANDYEEGNGIENGELWGIRPRVRKRTNFKKQYSKFRKIKLNVRVKLRKLSNKALTKVFSNKFKLLCIILNKLFNKPVELDLIRLHYPYKDSNILVNLLGIMINKIKLRIIFRKLFKKAVIKNKFIFNNKKVNIIPAFLSGLSIRVGGRLLTHKLVPRKTVKSIRRGATAQGKINFKDVATYTNKNKRGAFTITVKSGQNFFS